MPNSGEETSHNRAGKQDRGKKRPRRGSNRCLPELEALEDRLLPSFVPYVVANGDAISLTNVSGTLFFDGSQSGASTGQLWRSNGTASGTSMVRTTNGAALTNPFYLTNLNGTLFFSANFTSPAGQLWRSDGTPAGTTLVASFTGPGYLPSWSPALLTNVNGTLFFLSGEYDVEGNLWRSNGTPAGTTEIAHAHPFLGVDIGGGLANVDGTLFFSGGDNAHGVELWRSDGTAAGTRLVTDIRSGYASSYPTDLTNVNGTLFFAANDGIHGTELWRSNGTVLGTTAVADISPKGGWDADALANVNGTLFLAAADAAHGTELWRSDGTTAGTTMIADIDPGSAWSDPYWLTNVSGTLFFDANDGVHGYQLWCSNGTSTGTRRVLGPNGPISNAMWLANVSGKLFFCANDSSNGSELWALPVAPTSDTATAITASDNSPGYGETVTYTATISALSPATGVPADGTVTFQFDGGPGITANVSNGQATITHQWLSAGPGQTVDATFNGDDSAGQFSASTAPELSVNVAQAEANTTISLSPSNDSSVYGQNWAATATVKALPGFGSGSPTSGTVVFTDTMVTNSSSSGTFQLGGKTTITLGSAPVALTESPS